MSLLNSSFAGRLQPAGMRSETPQRTPQRPDELPAAAMSAPRIERSSFESLRSAIHIDAVERLRPLLKRGQQTDSPELTESVVETIESAIVEYPGTISERDQKRLRDELMDEILGYGALHKYLRDDSISEIMVNGFDSVYIERNGVIERCSEGLASEEQLMRIIKKMVSDMGRRIDESSPMIDARLPDGSRVNAIIPPLAVTGAYLTIRKFRQDPLTTEELVAKGTLSPRAAEFLQHCVAGGANILISGGTSSGKTTTLNVLSSAISERERIITIEDTAELRLKQEHVLTLESRSANAEGSGLVAMRDLVRNSLRMRPDRIIIGECRGPEAVDMLQAMNTGHDGSMTTLHANEPREALSRLETLVLTAGADLPLRAIREQIASAVDIVVQVSRLVDGTRRITHITEVVGMEGDMVTMQDLFVASPVEGNAEMGQLYGPLCMTGIKPGFLGKLTGNGVRIPSTLFVTEKPHEVTSSQNERTSPQARTTLSVGQREGNLQRTPPSGAQGASALREMLTRGR